MTWQKLFSNRTLKNYFYNINLIWNSFFIWSWDKWVNSIGLFKVVLFLVLSFWLFLCLGLCELCCLRCTTEKRLLIRDQQDIVSIRCNKCAFRTRNVWSDIKGIVKGTTTLKDSSMDFIVSQNVNPCLANIWIDK